MTDKIKSLDRDFIFGELDTEAMLRAEIERLRAALQYARQALTNIAHDTDLDAIRSTANVGLGMSAINQQQVSATDKQDGA